MPLEIIGVGMPRSGTESLKRGLEMLGYKRCYHMVELIAQPAHLAHWEAAANANAQAWETVFSGFRAAVDFPAMFHWRRLLELYPAARVILTLRDPDDWFDSMQATILSAIAQEPVDDPATVRRRRLVRRQLVGELFAGRASERGYMRRRFAQHQREVRAHVPAARLLQFDVREGWAPLCAFLNVVPPATAFPRGNSTTEFRARYLAVESPD